MLGRHHNTHNIIDGNGIITLFNDITADVIML